jgi:SAM-dependent methyltransferase
MPPAVVAPVALELDAYLAMLPPPTGTTVEVTCGAGPLGTLLARAGHDLVGVEPSHALAARARQTGTYGAVLHAEPDDIRLPAASAHLVVSFMSLHRVGDVGAVVGELARVLAPGGRLAIAVPHPLPQCPSGDLSDYFTATPVSTIMPHGGKHLVDSGWRRPIRDYTAALERAGLVLASLREPGDVPLFLHLLAVRPPHAPGRRSDARA